MASRSRSGAATAFALRLCRTSPRPTCVSSRLSSSKGRAEASVQLADGTLNAREAEAELPCENMVGERSIVAQLHLLSDVEIAVLHHITDRRNAAADDD